MSAVNREAEFLEDRIKQICKEFYDFFDDKPDHDGRYFHLGICSGNYYKPIGYAGCVCRNATIFRRMKTKHDWVDVREDGFGYNKGRCTKCGDESSLIDGWCTERLLEKDE